MWNPSTCGFECNKACKIDEYLDIKKSSCEKHLIGKIVLECEVEILVSLWSLLGAKYTICLNGFN